MAVGSPGDAAVLSLICWHHPDWRWSSWECQRGDSCLALCLLLFELVKGVQFLLSICGEESLLPVVRFLGQVLVIVSTRKEGNLGEISESAEQLSETLHDPCLSVCVICYRNTVCVIEPSLSTTSLNNPGEFSPGKWQWQCQWWSQRWHLTSGCGIQPHDSGRWETPDKGARDSALAWPDEFPSSAPCVSRTSASGRAWGNLNVL